MVAEFLCPPGTPQDLLDTPCLCIDLPALERNINTMASFVAAHGVACRPHSKTCKCPAVCVKQIEAGAKGICAAKVGAAEALVAGGIKDILITTEVIGSAKIARLMSLCAMAKMTVVADDPANVANLSEAAETFGVELGILIDVNVRINRCGVEPGQPAVDLARLVAESPGLRFRGVMGYEGTIRVSDFEERTPRLGRRSTNFCSRKQPSKKPDCP